jgi:hypothetical protein
MSYDIRSTRGSTVKLICDPATSAGAEAAMVTPQAIRLVGNRLLVNASSADPVTVRVYSVNGKTVLSRQIARTGVIMDLGKLQLPSGLYVARVSRRQALKKSVQVLIP